VITKDYPTLHRSLAPLAVKLALAAWALVYCAGAIVGGGAVIRILYPLLTLLVGVLLYQEDTVFYQAFVWWVWILSALFARLVDYHSGWDAQRIILLAPYLVTLIPLITLLRDLPRLSRDGAQPFLLAGAGLLYAALIGFLNNPPFGVMRSLLDWLCPIVLGLYYLRNWRLYPQYVRSISQVFLWGVLLTGLYGVFQYLVAPAWDQLWLIESQLASAGQPEPLKMRIWSTMHSPGAFALFMMAGLLILLTNKSALSIPISGVGYLAILLSLVRTAWIGWGIGVIMIFTALRPKFQIRLIISALCILLCAIPLTTMEPFATTIDTRVQSLVNPSEDNSVVGRANIYDEGFFKALLNPVGNGMGSSWFVANGKTQSMVVDSGFIDLFLSLGWIGALPYMTGLAMLLTNVAQIRLRWPQDSFMSTGFAIGVVVCIQMLITTTLIGMPGNMTWGFLGLAIGGNRFYLQKSRMEEDSPLAEIL
jgi:O-Antigen ligase